MIQIIAFKIYSFSTHHVLIEVHCCSGECSSDKLSFVELKFTMMLAMFHVSMLSHLVIVVYLDGDQGRGPLDVLPPPVDHQPREHQELVPGGRESLVNHLGKLFYRSPRTRQKVGNQLIFHLSCTALVTNIYFSKRI